MKKNIVFPLNSSEWCNVCAVKVDCDEIATSAGASKEVGRPLVHYLDGDAYEGDEIDDIKIVSDDEWCAGDVTVDVTATVSNSSVTFDASCSFTGDYWGGASISISDLCA